MSILENLKKVVPHKIDPSEDPKLLYDFLFKRDSSSVVIPEKEKDKKEDKKEIKKEVKKEAKEEAKKELVWGIIKEGKSVPFDSTLHKQIEEAAKNGRDEFFYVYKDKTYKINLKKSICINMSNNTSMKLIKTAERPKIIEVVEVSDYDYHIDGEDNIKSEQKNIDIPPEWSPCTKTKLDNNSSEFNEVKKLFDATMKGIYKDILIEKLDNKRVKYFFEKKLTQMSRERNVQKKDLTKRLFHGTSHTKPSVIYDGYDTTFDPKYAAVGLWGTGTYFALNAVYSTTYAYNTGDYHQMFLADVIIGNYFDLGPVPWNELIYPPEEIEGEGKRFDSVKARTLGNDIYIVYDTNMAYPTYLISYRIMT